MKIKFVIYAALAIALQVALGEWTGKGQGGIGMLLFTIFIELDPEYSFTTLFKKQPKPGEKE